MATSTNRLQINVSADAAEAVSAFKEISAELKGLGTGSEDVATQTDKVTAALLKMGKAQDSPRQLATAVGLASFQVKELQRILNTVPMGKEEFDKVKTAVSLANVEIEKMKQRAGELKVAMGDSAIQSKTAAQGLEALAGSAGSAGSMLSQLKATSTGLGAKIADAGFAAIALEAALTLGITAGTKFDAVLKEQGVDLSKANSVGDVALKIYGAYAIALARAGIQTSEFSRAAIEGNRVNAKYGDGIVGLLDPINKVMAAKSSWAVRTAELDEALKKAGITFIDWRQAVPAMSAAFTIFQDRIQAAAQKGGNLAETARLNVKELQFWQHEIDMGRISLDRLTPSMQAALLMGTAMAGAQERQAAGVKALRDGIGELNPELEKIVNGFRDENRILLDTGFSYEKSVEATRKYEQALKDFADAHNLSLAEVKELINRQNTLKVALDLTRSSMRGFGDALLSAKPSAEQLRLETEKLRLKVEEANAGYLKFKLGLKEVQMEIDSTVESIRNGTSATDILTLAQEKLRLELAKDSIEYGKLSDAIDQTRRKQSDLATGAGQVAQALIDMGDRVVQGANALAGGQKAMAGTTATMEILQTELMHATDAQTASLEKQLDVYRRLREEMGAQVKSLEDYAATMLAAWQGGTQTLTAWNEQMTIAITQMDIMIMKNAGTKFAADTKKMADALRELQAAVNMGKVPQDTKVKF